MSEPNDIFAAIDKAAPMEARSSLTRWMRQNFDQLALRLDGNRPDWRTLAEVFDKAGLRTRDGNPPSSEATKKAWQRVRKSILAARAKQASYAAPAALTSAATSSPEGTPHERRGSTPGPRFAFNNQATDDDLARLTGVKPKPR